MRDAYKVLGGKPEGKIQFGRPWHKLEDRLKVQLQEIRYEDVVWIHLGQDKNKKRPLLETIVNLQVSYKACSFFTNEDDSIVRYNAA
jgi:hypothetical protein